MSGKLTDSDKLRDNVIGKIAVNGRAVDKRWRHIQHGAIKCTKKAVADRHGFRRGYFSNVLDAAEEQSAGELVLKRSGYETVDLADDQGARTLILVTRGAAEKFSKALDMTCYGEGGFSLGVIEQNEDSSDRTTKYRLAPIDEGKELRDRFPGFGNTDSLVAGLKNTLGLLERAVAKIEPTDRRGSEKRHFRNIEEYWDAEELKDGVGVKIRGSFSVWSPLVLGHPHGKADLHDAFRGPDSLRWSDSLLADALMSLSACQLNWNIGFLTNKLLGELRVCSLQQSISRNSLLVLVGRDYFERYLTEGLKRCGGTVEAIVDGCHYNLPQYKAKILNRDVARKASRLNSDLRILLVRPKSGNRSADRVSICRQGSRYLDGDLFKAVQVGHAYELFTRFTNLASLSAVELAQKKIDAKVQKKHSRDQFTTPVSSWDLRKLKEIFSTQGTPTFATPQEDIDLVEYCYPATDGAVESALRLQDEEKTDREIQLLRSQQPSSWAMTLDFGCGVGRNLPILDEAATSPCLIVGVEPDKTRATLAQEMATSLCNAATQVVCGDIGVVDTWRPRMFDHAIAVQVLGHVPRVEATRIIRGIHRVLRTGATFTLCVPVVGDAFEGEQGSQGWRRNEDYFHFVDLRLKPFSKHFRVPTSADMFDAAAEYGGGDKLPVRCFYQKQLPQCADIRLPFEVETIPHSIFKEIKDRFDVVHCVVYSIHRLTGVDDNRAAIGDLLLTLRAR